MSRPGTRHKTNFATIDIANIIQRSEDYKTHGMPIVGHQNLNQVLYYTRQPLI